MADLIELRAYDTGPIPDELLALLPAKLHIGETGRTVTRERIEKLGPDERRSLWFDGPGADGQGTHTYFPFYDDTGVVGLGPAEDIPPFMRYQSLTAYGWTDNQLEAERQRLFGDRAPGELELNDDLPETIPLMERRYVVWRAVLAAAYKDQQ